MIVVAGDRRDSSSLTAAIAMGVRGDASPRPATTTTAVRSRRRRRRARRRQHHWDDGKPVTGLTASDFSVDVDGRQRRLVSAQYVSTISEGAPASPTQSTFSTNTARGGRMILFVVDRATSRRAAAGR